IKIIILEGIVVRSKICTVKLKAFACWHMSHIVISGYAVDGYRRIELGYNTLVFSDLFHIGRLIYQITIDHDEGRVQAVGSLNSLFKVFRLLLKAIIVGKHPELSIRQHKKEEGFGLPGNILAYTPNWQGDY